ncbi:predicted protein [Plenodomus lingam JN3]|uniref:Predicted protein n=1 Tax=Leptosphaeria maculans (strain JN3 / isolate v23.1.3 / race Av1-4-5-6-7-8) TaxID=985895 RepID=E5AA65_LEPMJ|nr:predicted protein [Plenodomus lingam JN3]CBY00556.1 predicted protein [Plenodomus lingam JN3]
MALAWQSAFTCHVAVRAQGDEAIKLLVLVLVLVLVVLVVGPSASHPAARDL